LRINKRSQYLLISARDSVSLKKVNHQLKERMMEPIAEEEWNLWVNFYEPLASSDPVYEKEIVCNDRPLAWFARDLKERHNKTIIS